MLPKVEIIESIGFFNRIKSGDSDAFKIAFDAYYRHLVLYANRFMCDTDMSENIVQNVFVTLWEKRDRLQIDSIKAYLIVSVRNQCHNELKHRKVVRNFEGVFANSEVDTLPEFSEPEIMDRINRAIGELPEQRRKIFTMNRVDGMRYKEIADALHLSPKTIEVQIGLALKFLRQSLVGLRSSVYHHN